MEIGSVYDVCRAYDVPFYRIEILVTEISFQRDTSSGNGWSNGRLKFRCDRTRDKFIIALQMTRFLVV